MDKTKSIKTIDDSALIKFEGVTSLDVSNKAPTWLGVTSSWRYNVEIDCDNFTIYAPDHYDYLKRVGLPKIRRVIFSKPCTIVLWEDGTKTIVRCKEKKFDKEKGLAMCIAKKALGNKGKYYDTFKEWLQEEEK